ncbi:MAG TPA: hypothetical protein VN970_08345 [Thermoanaerobaculia bacterium]|nr:hypothetical protein [Thermoanaerobaculia bacterium]
MSDDWITLRKGGTHLYLEYGSSFTNNLLCHNVQVRIGHDVDIRLTLTPNLRTRNKQSSDYIDARDLADGAIAYLTLLQLEDAKIVKGIARSLKGMPDMPRTWRLTISLEQEWPFEVEPEWGNALTSLLLHVQPSR